MTPLGIVGDVAGSALADQLDALDALGWSAIDLRTVDGAFVAELDRRAFHLMAGTLAARRVRVVCVDSRIGVTGDFARDLDELRMLTRRCADLGARFVRVTSYGAAAAAELRELAGRAANAGLVLLHDAGAGVTPSRLVDLVAAVDSPALRLLLDTGCATRALADLIGLVEHVRVTDDLTGPTWTVDGLAGLLRRLAATGYRGALSVDALLPAHVTAAGRTLESLLTAAAR